MNKCQGSASAAWPCVRTFTQTQEPRVGCVACRVRWTKEVIRSVRGCARRAAPCVCLRDGAVNYMYASLLALIITRLLAENRTPATCWWSMKSSKSFQAWPHTYYQVIYPFSLLHPLVSYLSCFHAFWRCNFLEPGLYQYPLSLSLFTSRGSALNHFYSHNPSCYPAIVLLLQ